MSRPNPFADHTRIDLAALGPRAPSSLEIVDAAGRRVFEAAIDASARDRGYVEWDGRDANGRALPGGVYFYRLTTGAESRSGSVIIAR